MNIGVSIIGYESKNTLNECIKPWNDLRDSHNVRISCAHGVFNEVSALGGSIYSADGTHEEFEFLANTRGLDYYIDNYVFINKPAYEYQIRNATLPYLMRDFDGNGGKMQILILVDADEIYTLQNIHDVLKVVETNKFMEWYKIKFLNSVKYKGKNARYFSFNAPRIWRNDKNGGIRGFWYDNNIEWNNSIKQEQAPYLVISNPVIKHLSWTGSDEYLKRKVDFARLHYGQCSFKWTDSGLEFDKEYYRRNNKEIPELIYLD